MTNLLDAITGAGPGRDPRFPDAPSEWTPALAEEKARQEGVEPGDDLWEAIRALQEYWARHALAAVNLRELHDALDERFHRKGGMRYLYQLLPGGPVAQGCRLAGLKAPAGAEDKGFGSVA